MLFAILRAVRRATTMLLMAAVALLGCGADESSAKRTTIVTGLHVPWGIAFLPGGDALIAERTTGKIVRVDRRGKHKRTARPVPGVATGAGEGGLLGLAVSPNYRSDGLVYAYFT